MKNGNYNLSHAPEDYPGKKYRGKYCQEHHLVWWMNTGVAPGPDELVHHKNEIKTDNRFENLELKKRKDHTSEHNLERGRTAVELCCPSCKVVFIRDRRRTHLIRDCKLTFCTQACSGRFNFPKATKAKIEKAQRENVIRVIKNYTGVV